MNNSYAKQRIFPAIFAAQSVRQNCGKAAYLALFSVFSGPTSFPSSQSKFKISRAMVLLLAAWIFAGVPTGFGESFDGRPADGEMDNLVTLGTESGHGVYERCYATQYSTNPAYYVSPPSFIGTNGWYLSTSVMQSLDDKAKALVQYYADPDTAYDGTTNIVMLMVTNLWPELGIGDRTNQFTGMPAIGTNSPTYGDYPWRMYPESLAERSEVLNALKWTTGSRSASVNGSTLGTYLSSYILDLYNYVFSNKTTYALTTDVRVSWIANVLGMNIYYDYNSDTNQAGLGPDWESDPYYKLNYSEIQECIEWWFSHFNYTATPPYTTYPDGYFAATNQTGLGAGNYIAIWQCPYEYDDETKEVYRWYWMFYTRTEYSTWIFSKNYPSSQLSNSVSVYIKPTLMEAGHMEGDQLYTAIATNDYYMHPREWYKDTSSPFEELNGLPTNVYSELDPQFFRVNGNDIEIEFGSDQLPPIADVGSFSAWGVAPENSGLENDNTGSKGSFRGLYLQPDNYFFIRKWDFQYCTDE